MSTLKERLDRGEELPEYFKNHIIYYAGPAKTPRGYPSGSFGPTTAARMDPYVPVFQAQGGSMVMLAKGNRSKMVTEACRQFGGFYLGSIGGPAARLGKECITNVEVLEYPELGMEAIFGITVKDFPAFILVDDKGNVLTGDHIMAICAKEMKERETLVNDTVVATVMSNLGLEKALDDKIQAFGASAYEDHVFRFGDAEQLGQLFPRLENDACRCD